MAATCLHVSAAHAHAPGHGEVLDELRVEGIRLLEVRHLPARALPMHAHDTTKLCVVVSGVSFERCGVELHAGHARTVVARSADAMHQNQYHARGAHSLLVELDPAEWRVRRAMAGRALRTAPALFGGLLVAAFRARASERRRLARAAVRSILEAMSDAPAAYPAWLDAARELLVERLEHPPSLAELACQVGVHPIHLAQAFRARTGTTPGRFVRAHRVFRALELIDDGRSLADAAHAAGFADQSHMTRAVRLERGAPPGALRRLRSGASAAAP